MNSKDVIKALEESESRFHDIADRISEGLWVRSAKGQKCLYLNPAFEEIWGRTLNEMNSIAWGDTIHSEDRGNAYSHYLKHQNDGKDYTHSYRIIRPDNSIRWIENHGYSVLDTKGNLLRMAGIARDITDRKKMEAELRLSQKLTSLGKLTSGIAHEINTPCQYLNNNITFFSESIEDVKGILNAFTNLCEYAKQSGVSQSKIDDIQGVYNNQKIEYLLSEIPSSIEESQKGIKQINKIVSAMKGFSHPGGKKELADLNKVISNAILISNCEWKSVAKITTDFCDKLPELMIVPSAINQVVLNLLTNSAHAINDVKSRTKQGEIAIKTYIEDDYVKVSITDNGTGIPDEIREKIFDPFYTNKKFGLGSGQGLSIAYKIIYQDHQGSIDINSIPGKGSCFTLNLPLK